MSHDVNLDSHKIVSNENAYKRDCKQKTRLLAAEFRFIRVEYCTMFALITRSSLVIVWKVEEAIFMHMFMRRQWQCDADTYNVEVHVEISTHPRGSMVK